MTKLCLKSARKTESNKPIKIKNLKRLSNVYFLYYCGEMHNIFYFFWTEVSKWHFTLINLQKWTNYLLSTIIFVMKWINKWLFIQKISTDFQNFFFPKAYEKCSYFFSEKNLSNCSQLGIGIGGSWFFVHEYSKNPKKRAARLTILQVFFHRIAPACSTIFKK